MLTFLDGTQEERDYACCGLKKVTARDGLITDYAYDSLGRIEYTTTAMSTANQQVVRHVMDPAGNVTAVYHGPNSSDMKLAAEMDYGLDGTLLKTRDRFLDSAPSKTRETKITFGEDGNGQQVTTTTFPNGSTRVETDYDDARLYQVSGSAVHSASYGYGVEQDSDLGYAVRTQTTILLNEAGAKTTSYEKTFTDALGRTYKMEIPAADGSVAVTRYYYNTSNQLVREEDADGVSTLYAYDSEGKREVIALDVDDDGVIDYDGTDRITRSRSIYKTRKEDSDSYTVQRQTTEVWETDNQDSATVISTVDRSLNDLPGSKVGSVSWSTIYGQTTRAESLIDRAAYKITTTTTLPDTSYQIEVAVNGLPESSTRYDGDDSILSKQTYNYDNTDENWLVSVTDLYSGTTQYAYYGDGQTKSIITPDPDITQTGAGYDPQTTSYTYTNDSISISRITTLPDGSTVTETFYPTGKLKETYGSQAYPAAYTYDYAGRLRSQTTWQDKTADTGEVLTAWEYYPNGLLKKKWYEASIGYDGTISGTIGPSYTYTTAGRLATRANARGSVATYDYAPNTYDLSSISYGDGITPAVSYPQYDRQGRAKKITDASGTRELTYKDGQLLDENYTTGTLSGYTIDRKADSLNRLDVLTLKRETSEIYKVDYGYDTASRLETVAHGQHTVTYRYDPSAELRETRNFNNGLTDILKTEYFYDQLNRLKQIKNLNAPSVILNASAYQYNDLNQRKRLNLADGSYWEYDHDSLGQVERAVYKDASDSAFPGRDFGFTFDDIGNRTKTKINDRTATYTSNNLNQYDLRGVPRALDVSGSAHADSTVVVNGSATTRKGNYFYHELDFSANGNGAQQVDILATATLPDGGDNGAPRVAEVEKRKYLPPNPEIFKYDAAGNLTRDSQWFYVWDSENRLIEMKTRPIIRGLGVPEQKLEFGYDSQGRRFSKKVYDWDNGSSSYALTSKFLYLYDGWNLITEFGVQSFPISIGIQRSYVWGLDLSSSLQGAGGVGGLLAVIDETGSTAYPSYDGNGNIMGYYAADTGESIATFEYGPFGELIRATGAKKDAFNFRFSTKYQDTETELLYYGYRHYNAETGRWLNRDPLGEIGELNLYGMVGNNPISRWDYLGMVGDDQIMRIQFVSSIIDSIHGASAFGYGEAAIAYLKTRGSWDSQGVELFRNWMNGFGDFTRFDDPSWSKYMKDNSILRIETRRFIVNKVISNSSDNEKVVDVDEQLSVPGIATGTGWLVGYDLLNGPNQTVGGYHIKGKITICGKKSEGSLRYTFNDLTDENGITDIIQSLGARIITIGRARNFKTKISWESDFEAQMNGNQLEGNGWPFSE